MDGSTAVLAREEGNSDYPRIITSPPQLAMRVVNGGATHSGQWQRRLDPTIGLSDLQWFQENVRELVGRERQWIGILGRRIVGSGDSFAEVRDRLAQDGIRDALIVQIPANVGRREYFIG
jgi:hypothetical protein